MTDPRDHPEHAKWRWQHRIFGALLALTWLWLPWDEPASEWIFPLLLVVWQLAVLYIPQRKGAKALDTLELLAWLAIPAAIVLLVGNEIPSWMVPLLATAHSMAAGRIREYDRNGGSFDERDKLDYRHWRAGAIAGGLASALIMAAFNG